ncbi:serine hydroxymethyltransferase [Streptomyces sp. NPDC059009]|uniref:serine hydroxymethyltransferase n=1 Tax=Streptomyces sp. NPDC059009 TaxID=3346694 RepID=UPI003692BB9D
MTTQSSITIWADPEPAGTSLRESDGYDGPERGAHSDTELAELLDAEANHPTPAPAAAAPSRHADSARLEQVERLAVARATKLFGARYANVRPHSCAAAHRAVLAALLSEGETVLGPHPEAGGRAAHATPARGTSTHGTSAAATATHAAPSAATGRERRTLYYGLDRTGRVDYAQVEEVARRHRPRVIVAEAGAYPRRLDFARLRAIADAAGAYLLVDISHVAGLVAAGEHPSPVDTAHITTTNTHQQLGGPRGGLILSGRDHRAAGPDGCTPLERLLHRAVRAQAHGAPSLAAITAKERAFALAARPEFRRTARLIVENARALAWELAGLGYRVLAGGTDDHMVLVDIVGSGLTGAVAERALSECGILAHRYRIPGDLPGDVPGDAMAPSVAVGLRLGTNALAQRGMGPEEMAECARLLHTVLQSTKGAGTAEHRVPPALVTRVREDVARLCARHPLPHQRTIRTPALPNGAPR